MPYLVALFLALWIGTLSGLLIADRENARYIVDCDKKGGLTIHVQYSNGPEPMCVKGLTPLRMEP